MRLSNRTIILFLAVLGLSVFSPAQTTYAVIDPNADTAPADIKALQLSFRLNTQDIMAPTLLLSDDGTRAFTNYIVSGSHPDNGYVLVVHPRELAPANQFIKAIAVGKRPGLMYFNPSKSEIWVVNMGNYGTYPYTECSISIIDTAALTVKATIPTPEYNFGFGSNVVFTPDGATAYVSSTLSDEVLKIDAVAYQVTSALKLLSRYPYYYISVGPAQLTLSHDGTFLCCTNTFNETVSVISTATFTETHQISFFVENPPIGTHSPNLTYRNNVLLSDDDSLGFVGSIGYSLAFGVADLVYLFKPATGERYKDEQGKYHDIAVPGDPMKLQLDPSHNFLVIQNVSYDKVDSTGINLRGYACVVLYTWPDLYYYKTLSYESPDYNMASSTEMAFTPNGDGTWDILFPSFSSFNQTLYDNHREVVPRLPTGYLKQSTAVTILNTSDTRMLPVTMAMIPGSGTFLVADYLTGVLKENAPPDNMVFSVADRIFIETGHFSSVALINPTDQPISYWVQSFQTNDTNTTDDDVRAGYPFFWVDSESKSHIIEPYELTLAPGQQLVRMTQGLIPDYDKVTNQHGFLKAVHPTEPLRGVVFNGTLAADGTLLKAEYLRVAPRTYQDMIFPCLYSTADVPTSIHYVNPYMNMYEVNRIQYVDTGQEVIGGNVSFIVPESGGIDQNFGSVATPGYVRVFNTTNVLTNAYMTVEGKNAAATFLYACPPLNIQLDSSEHPFHVPYYAVGGGFDTTLYIVCESPRTIAGVVDGSGNLINQYTHLRLDFRDFQGNLTVTKEFDVLNHSEFLMTLSMPQLLGHDKYSPEVWTGSITITADHDQVCGAYSYTFFRTPPEGQTVDPLLLFKNMTMDELRFGPDASTSILFPYTVNIQPYYTSYVLYNPNEAPATVRVEIYNPDGQLVAQSLVDPLIGPHAQFFFFLGDEWLFGPVEGLQNFVGYMKVIGTNDQPIFATSIQGTDGMMTIIPTL